MCRRHRHGEPEFGERSGSTRLKDREDFPGGEPVEPGTAALDKPHAAVPSKSKNRRENGVP